MAMRGLADGCSDNPTVELANNSLARAVFCLKNTASTALASAFLGAFSTYGALRTSEYMRWVQRRRGMRWMAPGAAAVIFAVAGSRLGMQRAIGELNAVARVRRLHEAEALLQSGSGATGVAEGGAEGVAEGGNASVDGRKASLRSIFTATLSPPRTENTERGGGRGGGSGGVGGTSGAGGNHRFRGGTGIYHNAAPADLGREGGEGRTL